MLYGISDREKYIESLELIRSLDFDLVVPGIAAAGEHCYAFVQKAEAYVRREVEVPPVTFRVDAALPREEPTGGCYRVLTFRRSPLPEATSPTGLF